MKYIAVFQLDWTLLGKPPVPSIPGDEPSGSVKASIVLIIRVTEYQRLVSWSASRSVGQLIRKNIMLT
jgi:hypothetical protein